MAATSEERIAAILAELRIVLDDAAIIEDKSRLGDKIATLGAELRDLAEGREPYATHTSGRLTYAARGTVTRRVRKALGYTYP